MVVKGFRPIEIVEASRHKKSDSKLQDDAFNVSVKQAIANVHVVLVTFTAPDVPGDFDEEFLVLVEDHPQPIPFKARGRIVEQVGDTNK